MLEWLETEGDRIVAAFRRVFDEQVRPFGSASIGWGGLSDGNEGVQWNVGFDPRQGERWVGVNLEGMKYDGWPVARLITRELARPALHDFIGRMQSTEGVRIIWTRDYWQATSRPRIIEKYIAPTPILLDALTPSAWHESLRGARECLEVKGREIRRATQTVTLESTGRRVEGPVSPHLTFRLSAHSISSWEHSSFAKGRCACSPCTIGPKSAPPLDSRSLASPARGDCAAGSRLPGRRPRGRPAPRAPVSARSRAPAIRRETRPADHRPLHRVAQRRNVPRLGDGHVAHGSSGIF